jgi:SAM-dependent methyltransferase
MRRVPVSILYPRYDHPAVEERYASWQAQMLLRRSGAGLTFYDTNEPARNAIEEIETEDVLVITDPLLLSSPNLPHNLSSLLGEVEIALPVSNESADERQRAAARIPYMTLRELQTNFAAFEGSEPRVERVSWSDADPGAFACRTSLLANVKTPLRNAVASRSAAISHNDYIHRWSSMRGQTRTDLLDRISPTARSVLEFGCGEAPLGAAIKARQKCRVVGVELDPRAAAIARKRIDDVYQGDVREIVSLIHERFDWIVGGDIVEHLDEPWSFLAELRRISAPGGRLLLSLPNLANVSVVNDLLQGRFDYVYMGLTCAGHLRFFTRRSIEEMLDIAGWSVESIETEPVILTPAAEALLARLQTAGVEFSRDDLLSPGYYVTAVNR